VINRFIMHRAKCSISRYLRFRRQRRAAQCWYAGGMPGPPPPLIKHQIIRDYANRFSLHTFVETGSFLGDTVWATKDIFDRIFTIELNRMMHERLRKEFFHLLYITAMQGDSAAMLPDILAQVSEPCLFWLDAHYSGWKTARGNINTPIMQELEHIFTHPVSGHVILIDDARYFIGKDHYPRIDQLKDFIRSRRPGHVCEVRNDIIRVHEAYDGR